MSLSAIIITQNEASRIEACLDSLHWVDEIVVVDAHSTDATRDICTRLGAKVYVRDWQGFGKQKNIALDLATGNWILSVDADERISAELRAEIQTVMGNPSPYVAYRIPRRSRYCGRTIHHSGWWPDYVLRLFKRDCGRFVELPVHERFVTAGQIGSLNQPLLHEAYGSLTEVLEKVERYSTLSAKHLHSQGKSSSLTGALVHGFWTFFRTYLLRAGFLDGPQGLMLAISCAEHSYYKHAKLYLLTRATRNKDQPT